MTYILNFMAILVSDIGVNFNINRLCLCLVSFTVLLRAGLTSINESIVKPEYCRRFMVHYSYLFIPQKNQTAFMFVYRTVGIGCINCYDNPVHTCVCFLIRCVICMLEFVMGDRLRFLPCMHTYHKDCIDDWLMRSFTCPSCMEPVDAALLTTYETN